MCVRGGGVARRGEGVAWSWSGQGGKKRRKEEKGKGVWDWCKRGGDGVPSWKVRGWIFDMGLKGVRE